MGGWSLEMYTIENKKIWLTNTKTFSRKGICSFFPPEVRTNMWLKSICLKDELNINLPCISASCQSGEEPHFQVSASAKRLKNIQTSFPNNYKKIKNKQTTKTLFPVAFSCTICPVSEEWGWARFFSLSFGVCVCGGAGVGYSQKLPSCRVTPQSGLHTTVVLFISVLFFCPGWCSLIIFLVPGCYAYFSKFKTHKQQQTGNTLFCGVILQTCYARL